MTNGKASRQELRKGFASGFIAALVVVSVTAGLPLWWFSTGRDMQTLHDGLSTQFRNSVAEILTVERYAAKRSAYENSVTVTHRDNALKYGTQTPGQYRQSELQSYIDWERELEFQQDLFEKLMELAGDPKMQNPANRQLLNRSKENADRAISNMQTAHSMMEVCRKQSVKC